MPIIMHLGRNINEYETGSEKIINEAIKAGGIRCEYCTEPMRLHSCYWRNIKETGQSLKISMAGCRACSNWHALLPDFILPNKHYSGNEVESVIIDSATLTADKIDTEASEGTARRWITQVGGRVRRAVNILKYIFMRAGAAAGEIRADPGPIYAELERALDMAPREARYSGNKLGLANIWLGVHGRGSYI